MATRGEVNMNKYVSEDDWKSHNVSTLIKAPKINTSIRDKSCIVQFPKNSFENRLTRAVVEETMRKQWGTLFDNVLSFGNIDFSRKWVFSFNSIENNELAIAKEIFINEKRVKTEHATRKFNTLKIDWVPLWTSIDDLAEVIKGVSGVSGRYVDGRWGRGDNINKDSTRVLLRFYKDDNEEFNPPQYVHYFDEYNNRIFLHLSVLGESYKCMRCNGDDHTISQCNKKFCHKCRKLVEKHDHVCFTRQPRQYRAPNEIREENLWGSDRPQSNVRPENLFGSERTSSELSKNNPWGRESLVNSPEKEIKNLNLSTRKDSLPKETSVPNKTNYFSESVSKGLISKKMMSTLEIRLFWLRGEDQNQEHLLHPLFQIRKNPKS